MNWMVAEAAMFHGGADGNCEDEAEAEAAAFEEHRRRQAASCAAPAHADASAVMAAEHRKQRERDRQRLAEQVKRERGENAVSTSLVGSEFGLPQEVSGHILSSVGEPTGRRTFDYARTHQAQSEAEHARRLQLRAGVVDLERRVDGYTNELVGGSGGVPTEQKWEELPTVTTQEAKQLVERGNAQLHGAEDKQFVQMFRS